MPPCSRLVRVVGLTKFGARSYLFRIGGDGWMPTAGVCVVPVRTFSEAELQVVTEIVGTGGSMSRTQLMIRVCERLQWYRPTGALKVRECRDLLATMERAGWFRVAGETRADDRWARAPRCR